MSLKVMKKSIKPVQPLLAFGVLMIVLQGHAGYALGAEIYRHEDSMGNVVFSNVPRKKAERASEFQPQGVTTANIKVARPANSTMNTHGIERISSTRAAPVFASIEQRKRESDRKQILMDELQNEQTLLAKESGRRDVESVRRTIDNIEALKRELGRLN